MRRPKPCQPTPACMSTSAPRAERFCGQSLVIAACSVLMHRAAARLSSMTGRDYVWVVMVYSQARMKLSFVRLVATLLLSGQMLPVGLPLLCDQVQRATPANCEQQMASRPSGPAVHATTHASPCANSAFCAITAPAVVALGGAGSVSVGESHLVVSKVSTSAPADPRAPIPPPPQA